MSDASMPSPWTSALPSPFESLVSFFAAATMSSHFQPSLGSATPASLKRFLL